MRVGFFGKMGSGKTTASKFLVGGEGFRKESLAGTLKQIAELRHETDAGRRIGALYDHAFQLLPDPVYNTAFVQYTHPRTEVPYTNTPIQMLVQLWLEDLHEFEDVRDLYQRLGTDSGRFIKPAIWIDHFARNLKDGNVTVDDIRFLNEGEALEKLGFLKVKVWTPEPLRQQRLRDRDGFYEDKRQMHASETELEFIEPDVLIENTGDSTDLYRMIEDILARFDAGEYAPGMERATYRPGGVVGPVAV